MDVHLLISSQHNILAQYLKFSLDIELLTIG